MTGKEWLRQLLVKKTNECSDLASDAGETGNWDLQTKYEVAYFKLCGQLILLGGNYGKNERTMGAKKTGK